ncbi:hypothetical protein HYS00_01645 [Candidatus Microgenomates bacterium]|nr:hypothetical protein [Candidatus Microgenomates bacterium]
MAHPEGRSISEKFRKQANTAREFLRRDELVYPKTALGGIARAGEKTAKIVGATALVAHQVGSDFETVFATKTAGPIAGAIVPTVADALLCTVLAVSAGRADIRNQQASEDVDIEGKKLPHERKLLAHMLHRLGNKMPVRHIDADIATITAGPQVGMAAEIRERREERKRKGRATGAPSEPNKYWDLAIKHPGLFLATNSIAISQATDRLHGGAANTLYAALAFLATKRAYEVVTDPDNPTIAFRAYKRVKNRNSHVSSEEIDGTQALHNDGSPSLHKSSGRVFPPHVAEISLEDLAPHNEVNVVHMFPADAETIAD